MRNEACDGCLRRTDMIAALAGRIEIEWRRRRGRPRLLALADEALLEWASDPGVAARYERFDAGAARKRIAAAGMAACCRCDESYPPALRDLPDPPAVLHRSGVAGLPPDAAVAIVGARRASEYGIEVAHALGRGVASAGLPVVSGMALGVDSAAHAGALEAGLTVAVLAGGADVPYPASKRALHRRILASGAVVSEMPPGFGPYRWTFPARNRIIAAMSAGTVVVEGGERSGSLITADFAAELGRFVGAVPGPVTGRNAGGPNVLIKAGAELVRGPQDVLDLVFGVGRAVGEPPTGAPPQATPSAVPAAPVRGPSLEPALQRVLDGVESGRGSVAELADSVEAAREVAAALGELELLGLVRRTFGGGYVRAA